MQRPRELTIPTQKWRRTDRTVGNADTVIAVDPLVGRLLADWMLLKDGGPAGPEETHCTRGPEEVGGRLVSPVGNPVNPKEHEVDVHRVCETGLKRPSWVWAGRYFGVSWWTWGRDEDVTQVRGLPTSQGPATPRVDVHPQPNAGWVCRRRAVRTGPWWGQPFRPSCRRSEMALLSASPSQTAEESVAFCRRPSQLHVPGLGK